jgi:hypothetical protein
MVPWMPVAHLYASQSGLIRLQQIASSSSISCSDILDTIFDNALGIGIEGWRLDPTIEIIHRANCDAMASSCNDGGIFPLFLAPIAAIEALDTSDKNKAKAAEKAEKAAAREAQKEA